MNPVHCNNAAVSYLSQRGDHDSAIRTLYPSLRPRLRDALCQANRHRSSSLVPTSQQHPPTTHVVYPAILDIQDVEITPHGTADEANCSMMYNRAFSMAPCSAAEEAATTPSTIHYENRHQDRIDLHDPPSLCTAIMAYNLGLAYHQKAVQSGRLSVHLPRALSLYKLSYKFLKARTTCSSPYYGQYGHLLLALLNNLGDIHEQLFEYEIARQYLDEMQHVLACVCHDDEQNYQRFSVFAFHSLCRRNSLGVGPAGAA